MHLDGYGILWVTFAAVWLVSALGSKRTVRRQGRGSRIVQSILVGGGALLLFQPWRLHSLDVPFEPIGPSSGRRSVAP